MKKIIYLLSVIPLLSGCYEDKSSDRYDPIGAITVEGVEESYSLITLADQLQISPVVSSTDPSENTGTFEYLWTYYDNNAELVNGIYPVDTIQLTKDLEWDITLRPGSYTVKLQVTNPANDYSVYKTAALTVSTVFSNGYYFLKETAAGNTDLDFLNPDGTQAFDILETSLGAPITGSPTRLGYLSSYSYVDMSNGQAMTGKALVPMGGRDMKVLLVDDMSLIYDHDQLFFSGVAPDEKPVMAFLLSTFNIPMFVSNIGSYTVSGGSTGMIGYPNAPSGACEITGIVLGDMMSTAFDDAGDRLVYYDYGGSLMTLYNSTYAHEGITHHLLFMGTNGWTVFQDDANQSVRYLYQLNNSYFAGANAQPILDVRTIDASIAPNFNSAAVYGSNKSGATQMLYGGVGDKLYMYNTGSDTETLLMPSGMGAGETITMITHKTGIPDPDNSSSRLSLLMIGTYKDGNYKVYMYEMVGGVPDGAPLRVASGVGKVVDMQYMGASDYYYNLNY